MSALAPTLEAFFSQRLIAQRDASPRTVAAYRDTWRLLLGFASEQTGKQPCQLDIADLDAPLIGAFLDHLEAERGNSPRTRNARLAAIHSFYRFASLRHPEHAQTIARVIEIPPKRLNRPLISYLDEHEIKALLAAPDRTSWLGRRDHALLLVAIQTGLRVSELTTLRNRDISLGTGAHARVTGKGRKERCAMFTSEGAGPPLLVRGRRATRLLAHGIAKAFSRSMAMTSIRSATVCSNSTDSTTGTPARRLCPTR